MTTDTPLKPVICDLRFVYSHPAHWIAFAGGVGLIRWAPGTFGTLLAWPLFPLLSPLLPLSLQLGAVGLLMVLGCWACGLSARHLGIQDPGGIVWDETVAFLLILIFLPQTLIWQGAGFVVFRILDIFKPWPIFLADRHIKNGFGVMFDDLLAAALTLLILLPMSSLFS